MKTLGLIANTSSASKAFAQCLLPFSLKNGVVSVFEVIKSREAFAQPKAMTGDTEGGLTIDQPVLAENCHPLMRLPVNPNYPIVLSVLSNRFSNGRRFSARTGVGSGLV